MFLVVIGQQGKTGTLSSIVRGVSFRVGRDPTNELVLKHRSVSRRHCRIFLVNEQAVVEDAGSTNGTRVNGRVITTARPIDSTDEIEVGDYVMRVRSLLGDEQHVRFDTHERRKRAAKEPRSRGGTGTGKRPPDSKVQAKPKPTTPFEVLGITPTTPFDEARKAYRALMLRYHPDRVDGAAEEIREFAERRCKEFNEAWAHVEDRLNKR